MPALMQEINSLLHLDALTVNGKMVGENIEGHVLDREMIYSLERPIDHEGGIVVLKGNLVEDGH